MATLIDSNILIDALNAESPWQSWSTGKIAEARRSGPVMINQLILAEVAAGFSSEDLLNRALDPGSFRRDVLPWEAAFIAGRAFAAYRRGGGEKTSPMPDFYIGAHALVRGYGLISRDTRRYRTYFPDLDLIAPDTHP